MMCAHNALILRRHANCALYSKCQRLAGRCYSHAGSPTCRVAAHLSAVSSMSLLRSGLHVMTAAMVLSCFACIGAEAQRMSGASLLLEQAREPAPCATHGIRDVSMLVCRS